jgi:hypothetical protein
LILISVRGTSELLADALLDADANQVPFEEGEGKVHNGFYSAAKVAYAFVVRYLDKFYSGQKLLITGHSLGGAVALILSEMLRRDKQYTQDIVLYTYGAPRAADSTFIENAEPLVHHRIVNHNDPVPSVPATWMDTPSKPMYVVHGTVIVLYPVAGLGLFIAGLINFGGQPYAHHGRLRHLMPVEFGEGRRSSILWQPGCSIINDHGCAKALQQIDGLSLRGSFLRQVVDADHHSMVTSYIPGCWATLRRWQDAQKHKRSLVTLREFEWVSNALKSFEKQLNNRVVEIPRLLRPTPYIVRDVHESTVLIEEIEKLRQTRDRLLALHRQTVTEADVYGSHADQPEWVQDSLLRWQAHGENTVEEQLAMAPPPPEDHDAAIAAITGGHVVGAPYHLDIDSIV